MTQPRRDGLGPGSYLSQMTGDLPPVSETLDQTFGDLWGTPIPQELAAFFRLAASSWAVPELLEWTAGKDPFQLERSQNANSFERLLDHPELLTGPSSWFSGLIGVGWREPDATYTVQVGVRPDLSLDAPRRVYFRGDTGYHWFPVALSLSHHLSYGATLTAIGRGELAQDAAREAIASYTDLADTLSTQEVVKELTGDVRPLWSTHLPEDGTKQWGLRSGWIVQLLLGEDLFLVEQAFLEGRELNLPLTDELHQRYLAEALTSPPAALYGLWRTWFFSDPRVSDYVEAARRSPSRVVRDASEVVQQLLDGRKIVSKVDLIATRDAFAALRLDPDLAASGDGGACDDHPRTDRDRKIPLPEGLHTFFYPQEPDSKKWAVSGIGHTTGLHGCATFQPEECRILVTDDGQVCSPHRS